MVKQEKLLDNVQKTGSKLKCGLLELEKEFPNILHAVRGRGVFLAVSVKQQKMRDDILNRLKQKGKSEVPHGYVQGPLLFYNNCYPCNHKELLLVMVF